MATITSTAVQDAGLERIRSRTTALWLTTSQPSTYAAAVSARLAAKSAPSIGAPTAGTAGARKSTVAAISDGAVTANGTASHWALVDETNSEMLISNSLAANQVLSSGNPFTLPAFDITQAAPA